MGAIFFLAFHIILSVSLSILLISLVSERFCKTFSLARLSRRFFFFNLRFSFDIVLLPAV